MNPEIAEVTEADVLWGTEGDISEAKRRGASPGGLLCGSVGIEDRGMCGEGCQGTWEVPFSPSQDGTAARAKVSAVGKREVGVPQ